MQCFVFVLAITRVAVVSMFPIPAPEKERRSMRTSRSIQSQPGSQNEIGAWRTNSVVKST